MFNRKVLTWAFAFALFAGSIEASAQVNNPGVQQSGAVTAGHVTTWGPGLGQIQDGGGTPVTGPATPLNSYQWNNAGAFGGSGTLSHSGTTDTASGTFNFTGVFQVNGNTMTFPGAADTLASWGAANAFTGNNTHAGTELYTGAAFATASNGQASFGGDAANGAVIRGQGSTNDLTLQNHLGVTMCRFLTTATNNMLCTGALQGSSFVPTGVSVPGNGIYLPAANTVGISAGTVLSQSWTSAGTAIIGFITAAALDTAGTVAGSLCATSAGLFEYKVGVNCFGGAVTEQKNTASGGLVTSGNCDNTGSNAGSPCNYALTASRLTNPAPTALTAGTYTPAGTPIYIDFQLCGPGGGGGGVGPNAGSETNGGTGSAATIVPAGAAYTLTANGGVGGTLGNGSTTGGGGAGGTASGGNIANQSGQAGGGGSVAAVGLGGGGGNAAMWRIGASPVNVAALTGQAGVTAVANSGGGASGATSVTAVGQGAGGGGGGGCVWHRDTAPVATYAITLPVGGTAGAAGAGGFTGGVGSAAWATADAHYGS